MNSWVFLRRYIRETKTLPNGCIVWESLVSDRKGYQATSFGSSETIKIHRATYRFFVGKISKDLEIDHLCCNTSCCNSEHLEAVTSGENSRRIVLRGRNYNKQKTYCKRGHELTVSNTYVHSNGQRECKTCALKASKRRKRERWLK